MRSSITRYFNNIIMQLVLILCRCINMLSWFNDNYCSSHAISYAQLTPIDDNTVAKGLAHSSPQHDTV